MVTSKDYNKKTSDEFEGIVDYGLSVVYDEKQNLLLDPKGCKSYPIGGMISEYTNLDTPKVKDVIKSLPNLCEPATPENITNILLELHEKLYEEFEPIQAIMITAEFLNVCQDWFDACRNDRVEEFKNVFNSYEDHKKIKEYIFEGSNYTEVGGDTVEQLLYTAYLSFSDLYTVITYVFYQIIHLEDYYNEKDSEKATDLIINTLSENPGLQHIDFRIMYVEGEFSPVYTIKTPLSLLLFEIVHSVEKDVKFTKCANCGKVFVPDGRKDIKYCSYISPQNKEKTCRDIGAQISRRNKEKNDVFTREYRKVYGRLKMAKSRHPGNIKYTKKLATFVQEGKEWKSKLYDGTVTMEQFTEWIKKY